MSRLNILIAIVALFALVIGMKLWHHTGSTQTSGGLNAYVLSPPKDIDKFSLVDSNGKPFNNNTLWAHWTFIVFGAATHGSEEMSGTMSELNKMVHLLAAQKQTPIPKIVFVSIDPADDSLDALKKYAIKYNPDFIGVTGDTKQINLLYQNIPATQKTAILLMDPSGKLMAIFPAPHHAESMVKDFQIIVQNAG